MHQSFVEVNGVLTHVLTWGRWIESSVEGTNEIIILLVGNPGAVGFYNEFAKELHEKTGIPVWCIGHAGHNLPLNKSYGRIPKFDDNKELYGLKGQLEHKVDFFKKYVPKDAKVHLVGHSVGAYMILEVLEHPDVKPKIDDVYLIFPALEHMARTKNGKFLNNLIRPIVQFVVFLTWIFTILPDFLATFLLCIYMFLTNVPRQLHLENIKTLLKPGIIKRAFFLGFEEMDFIHERNNEVIKRNVKNIKFLYGDSDNWTEPRCWVKLKEDIPEVDFEVTPIEHTFIFNNSADVAYKLANWIKGKK